jgi:hypothetical protein
MMPLQQYKHIIFKSILEVMINKTNYHDDWKQQNQNSPCTKVTWILHSFFLTSYKYISKYSNHIY